MLFGFEKENDTFEFYANMELNVIFNKNRMNVFRINPFVRGYSKKKKNGIL